MPSGFGKSPAGMLAFVPRARFAPRRLEAAILAAHKAFPEGKQWDRIAQMLPGVAANMMETQQYGSATFSWDRRPGWTSGYPVGGNFTFSRFVDYDKRIQWNGHETVGMLYDPGWTTGFPLAEQAAVILGVCRDAIDALAPDFAAVDGFGKNLYSSKVEGVDLRRKPWGAALYGPEMVAAIGPDNFEGLDAFRVEPRPDGAMWVQASEDPFHAPPAVKAKLAKDLGLAKALFEGKGPINHGAVG
ncbi:MAG TPA: hypothetical protein VJ874_01380 [Candidatus Thermoplasmatota archaeon]|nr:hypothetical protein [Candidatus Thermoplasmatota archaeon]